MIAALGSVMNMAAAGTMGFTTVTTVMNSANQISHGWNQVKLKEADLAAQIAAEIKPPPIVKP